MLTRGNLSMKEKVRISVVIPMRNAKHTIFACLTALNKQNERPYEVIIVDNNSNDGSYEMVLRNSEMFPNLNIIISSQIKKGPAAARNKGISLATGEIIAFTDADCMPEKNWIKNILTIFQEDGDIDVVGGIEYGFYPMSSSSGKLLSVSWLPPVERQQKSIIRCKKDFFSGKFIATFNAAFKREMLLKISGFDEKFCPAGEDSDLWMRALEHNANILVWAPNMIVGHNQDISFIELVKKMFNYGKTIAHLSKRHFAKKIIMKNFFGIDYECTHSRFTIIIYSNMIEIFLLFFCIVLLFYLSFILANAVLFSVLIYAYLRIRRQFNIKGYEISISENGLILFYYMAKKISEAIGRIYGCLKYSVLCL